jgi:hypothetical protein
MEPRKIYKYRALDGKYDLSNAEDIIVHDRMRWQSPASFNDPFDCAPELAFGMDKAERKRFAEEATGKFAQASNRQERRRLAAGVKKRDIQEVRDKLFHYFQETMDNSSVTCFSLVENNLLMWAHYASSHTGICLEFEEKPEVGFFCLNVIYSDQRRVVDLTKFQSNGSEMLERSVLTKSTEWAYEKEVRMIEYNRPAGPRAFDPVQLKSITLGLKISSAHEQKILDFVSRRKTPIVMRRAVRRKDSFALISVPI